MSYQRLCPAVILLVVSLLTALPSYAAEPGAEEYARIVAAEPDLVSYWRLEDDLKDAKGTADGESKGGAPKFAEGPNGGKALVLEGGRFATFGETPQLDLPETTLELWFQPNFESSAYNPCIIAKRSSGDHVQTRFSIHVWGDRGSFALWNGSGVMNFQTADGPLNQGQWYYLVVTCTQDKVQLYLDGVLCPAVEQQVLFNFAQKNLPLSIGSSTPAGQEQLTCHIDEVAIYSKALTEQQIVAHLTAMGWESRREEFLARLQERLEREKQLRAQRAERHAKLTEQRLADEKLFERGQTKVYRDEYLDAVSLALGGIGAGTIQINGQAERAAWQIFNNYQYANVPHSFFAVRAKSADSKPIVRAVQTTPVDAFEGMKQLSFRGEYPFAWYDFEDDDLPVRVSMEAFSPLIPMDTKNSSIPCAIFTLSAENTTDEPVDVAFLAAQQNAVGFTGTGRIDGRQFDGYGANENRIATGNGATIVHMTTGQDQATPGFGDMALLTTAPGATATASWDNLQALAADLADDGKLDGPKQAGPSEAKQTVDGALAADFTLAPGEKKSVTFVLTWYFPNAKHGNWGDWTYSGNMYTNWWKDAMDVARHVHQNLDKLNRETHLYHDTFYAGNLPHWLMDRITSQVAVLRSKTCFWSDDGFFGAWEGCGRGNGCCPGNCTHVWHYAQAHARLFPDVARRMREQIFDKQLPDGGLPHRLNQGVHPATDGQLGDIIGVYREYLCSTDRRWLDAEWPKMQKAMEHSIAAWDEDEDGVLAGAQWNTLDGALGGSTSWIGSLYLTALEASARMAELHGDDDLAERYRKIRASGAKKQDETLFNGEYYIQIRDPQPRQDYGEGCAIDQVLGEWWAGQVGIATSYPPQHVRSALGAMLKYNFRPDFLGIQQVPRKFVHDADPGLQMIQWPKTKRPNPAILYGDEVMTGFEYPAAAAMVQYGMMREGFMVTRAIYDRYDGRLRTGLTDADTASWGYSGNPFGDDECGKFYARAMSVWSMLLVCQGFDYNGPEGAIGFKPLWKPEDHASFFTGAEGWGLFTQSRQQGSQTERIELKYGQLKIRSLSFELPEKADQAAVTIELDGRQLPAKQTLSADQLTLSLDRPLIMTSDDVLEVHISRN